MKQSSTAAFKTSEDGNDEGNPQLFVIIAQ